MLKKVSENLRDKVKDGEIKTVSGKKIDPNKNYTIVEVLKQGLIPGVDKYSTLYSIITYSVTEDSKRKRVFVNTTTASNIKIACNSKYYHTTKVGITIKGSAIIKFLKLNNLIK